MASEVIDWRDKARAGIRIAALMAEQERLTALLAERDAAQALSAMTAQKFTEQLEVNVAMEAERDALRARAERAESVIRKALNDLDHGSLWDARAALAAASEVEWQGE